MEQKTQTTTGGWKNPNWQSYGWKNPALWDMQKSKVYAWERNFPGWTEDGQMSLLGCQDLVIKVWREHGITDRCAPSVLDGSGRRSACGGLARIKLPRWARSEMVVLHEVAHSLVAYYRRHLPGVPAHGGLYVRIYIDLLVKFAGQDRAMLRRTAEKAKVEIASSKECYIDSKVRNVNA